MNMNIDILSELFRSAYGENPTEIESLTGAGSNRRYYRLKSSIRSVVGVIGTNHDENKAFIYLARHFHAKGMPVPEIYVVADDGMSYLQEDFGSRHLIDAIADGRCADGSLDEGTITLLEKTLDALGQLQFAGIENLDFSQCYPLATMDERTIHWDLNYFKYCFLKSTGIELSENKLEEDFDALTKTILKAPSNAFMYRDFQSRNVMIAADGNPRFIDFQGGRKGPYIYDVVSFLWQAKACMPDRIKAQLIEYYLDVARKYTDINTVQFYELLPHFVLFRLLQVLGAYGYRGFFERKPHFIESVPLALENLRTLLSENTFEQYPYLVEVLTNIVNHPTLSKKKQPLKVKVLSFSYKKGIPDDASGNGGGFVFDCRAVHNPGHYDCYKQLTGLDEPVIRFLENDGEIYSFLAAVYALVDASVKRYMERGFTSLQICFGCTGGRHRSVYSAEHTAMHINERFGVEVELTHREQIISRILPAKNKDLK